MCAHLNVESIKFQQMLPMKLIVNALKINDFKCFSVQMLRILHIQGLIMQIRLFSMISNIIMQFIIMQFSRLSNIVLSNLY